MALEKLDGCSDAYLDANNGITLLYAKGDKPDEKALVDLLKPFKITPSGLTQSDKLPY